MKKLYVKDIINVCSGKLIYGDKNKELTNFSKDTRTIEKGDVYVAIKGENFDGNRFVDEAFDRGADIAITSSKKHRKKREGKTLVYVKDTVEALQKLAAYKRKIYDIPVIAITGSVGKTSTKEMVASVLEQKYKVLKTLGNYNNEIGLPLSILRLKDENVMVLEMGMNSFGEISLLSGISNPDIAIITNIGTSHIGELGGKGNILKAKLEILDGLKENGTLIINNDNKLLNAAKKTLDDDIKVITTGIKKYSDYNANDITDKDFTINASKKIKLLINNNAFIYNSLIAYAVGKELKIGEDKIIKGIESVKQEGSRLKEVKLKNDITVIDDAYNASFESIRESITYVNNTYKTHKIIVLGDVFELGKYSKKIHKAIGKLLAKSNIEDIVLIGQDIKYAKVKNSKYFKTKEEGTKYIKSIMKKGDVILLKASNGMHFNEILDALKTE